MAFRFQPGRVVATPGAIAALEEAVEPPWSFLLRHLSDWGELDAHDRAENEFSVLSGFRILSAYPLITGEKIWGHHGSRPKLYYNPLAGRILGHSRDEKAGPSSISYCRWIYRRIPLHSLARFTNSCQDYSYDLR